MKRLIFTFIIAILCAYVVPAQSAFKFDDLMRIKRVGDPQLSPDGKTIAYTVGDVNIFANKTLTQIYIISIDGGRSRQLTKDDKSSSAPRWSADGKKIAFVSGGQIWTMNADGDDKKKITQISTGAGNPVWSPDNRWIAFVSDVYPECNGNEDCNHQKEIQTNDSKMQAKVTERLLYRHWVEWRNQKRSHVFIVPANGGVSRDLTVGDFDSPPYAASSSIDYAFSPDSKEIAYLRNPDKVEAISTNSDIFTMSLLSGSAKNITVKNRGYDATPIYTRDGKYLIYRSQAVEGFEADRWRLMRYNRQTGETIELTSGFDLQVEDVVLSPDGKTIYFTAGKAGHQPIYSVPVEPNSRLKIATQVKLISRDTFASNLNITPDGQQIVFLGSTMSSPPEIFRIKTSTLDVAHSDGTAIKKLTDVNSNFAKLSEAEKLEWKGALNQKIEGFLLKPVDFDSSKKYPLLVLIHGGPQSAWNDSWGYRWNPQVFANAGYVVFMPNPRGSTGYGQKFVNEVSTDWGGRAYIDIMNGVAEVTKNQFIDKQRIGAAGASYGGYMINWILGHNNDPRFRFKALVSHAGIYNLESMAPTTEELWFVRYEFGGMPWENSLSYSKWSPHKFVKNFDTPTLVTAGEIDYRVPVDQDLQLFTALQLRGVKSKLIVFPDEGHWILKPQNSRFWYGQVLDWFDGYLKP